MRGRYIPNIHSPPRAAQSLAYSSCLFSTTKDSTVSVLRSFSAPCNLLYISCPSTGVTFSPNAEEATSRLTLTPRLGRTRRSETVFKRNKAVCYTGGVQFPSVLPDFKCWSAPIASLDQHQSLGPYKVRSVEAAGRGPTWDYWGVVLS